MRRYDVIQARMSYMQNSAIARQKEAVFTLIYQYSHNMKTAKSLLHRIFKHKESEVTQSAFEAWKNIYLEVTENDKKIYKQDTFAKINQTTQAKNKCLDRLHKIKAGGDKLEKKLQSQGRHIISNTTIRLLSQDLRNTFTKWARVTSSMKRKERILTKVINRCKIHYQQEVMKKWVHCIWTTDTDSYQVRYNKKLKEKKLLLESKEHKLSMLSDHNKQVFDKKQLIYQQNSTYMSDAQKAMSLLKQKNHNNYYFSPLRIILREWRNMVKDKKST